MEFLKVVRLKNSFSERIKKWQKWEKQKFFLLDSGEVGLTTEYRANFQGIFVGAARQVGSPD